MAGGRSTVRSAVRCASGISEASVERTTFCGPSAKRSATVQNFITSGRSFIAYFSMARAEPVAVVGQLDHLLT